MKKPKNRNFTQVSNKIVDYNLSGNAFKIYFLLLSKMDLKIKTETGFKDWKIIKKAVLKVSGIGREAFDTAWSELKVKGFLIHKGYQTEHGKFDHEYTLIPLPNQSTTQKLDTGSPYSDNGSPDTGKPGMVEPGMVEPGTANPYLNKIDESNTELKNTTTSNTELKKGTTNYTLEEDMNEKVKMMLVEMNAGICDQFAASVGFKSADELPALFCRKYENLSDRFRTRFIPAYNEQKIAHPDYSLLDWVNDSKVVELWKKNVIKLMTQDWSKFNQTNSGQQKADVIAVDEWVGSNNVELLQKKMEQFQGWRPNLSLLADMVEFVNKSTTNAAGHETRKVSHWCKSFASMKGDRTTNEELNKIEAEIVAKKNMRHFTYSDMMATPEQIAEKKARWKAEAEAKLKV